MKEFQKFNLPFICIAFFIFSSCKKTSLSEKMYVGETQGSTYSIKTISVIDIDMQKQIDSVLLAVDLTFSNYNSESLLTKINKSVDSVRVNPMFREVFEASKKIHIQSNYVFDPTIGLLSKAYGFGSAKANFEHTPQHIDSLLVLTGFGKVELSDQNFIKKQHPTMYLDFNAIAQGYTVDVLARVLKQKGFTDFIIEVGGELFALGTNKIKNKPWTVAIDNPQQATEDRTFIKTISLQNRGMATSGNYRKFTIDPKTGEKYVHTINPITGKPQKTNILSTTVLAPTAMEADGWSTSLMLMNMDQIKKLTTTQKQLDVFVLFLDQNNVMQSYMSQGFDVK